MPSEHGVWNNVAVSNALSNGFNDGVETWSESLKESGYQLYFSGKWHVSDVETPGERGFEPTGEKPFKKTFREDRGQRTLDNYRKQDFNAKEEERQPGQILRPGYGTYTHYGVTENPFNDQGKVNDAIDQLNKLDELNPWCMYVGTLGPHDPYFVPQKFLDLYPIEDIELPKSYMDDFSSRPNLYQRTRDRFSQLSDHEHKVSIQHYLAFCSYEDALFGQLLEALKKKGCVDNTMVIYLSDHGDYMAEHGLWCKGLPCFKGAYHIPCLMRWPNGISNPGRDVDEFIGLQDFAPTFTEIAQSKSLSHVSGSSLMPFLKHEVPKAWRQEYHTQSNGNELYGIQRSVTNTDFKLVYNGFDFDELYHLQEDPEEMVNLINKPEFKPVVKELYQKLWKHAFEHDDQCINPYIMVALAEYGPGVQFMES